MRTLREWDKYLRKQEEAVKKSGKKRPPAAVPTAEAERAESRTETSAPKSGAIIAAPAETPTRPTKQDPFSMPEIDDFVPAVSEPRPIPKEKEEKPAVSEPQPVPKEGTPTEKTQPELFRAPKRKGTAAKGAARPKKRRASKTSPRQSLTSPRLMELPPSVRDFFSTESDETAEKYYTKGFSESRHELVQRLLDPPLTLEETARVLGVCPTTVRRYTNKGVLSHYRTAGNQRRFKLSDVIAFVESHLLAQGTSTPAAPTQEPSPRVASVERPRTRKAPAAKASARETQPGKPSPRTAGTREASPQKKPARKPVTRRKPTPKASSRRKSARAAKTRR